MKTIFRTEDIFRIPAAAGASPGSLMATLIDIQGACRHLPRKALEILARRTGRSLVDLYGLVAFHPGLSLERRGVHQLSVCGGSACHVAGSRAVREELEHQLGIQLGETTADRSFSLHSAGCLGACAVGPVVVADGTCHRSVTPAGVGAIIGHCQGSHRQPPLDQDPCFFPVEVACPVCNASVLSHEHRLDGHRMVALDWTIGSQRGWVRLSSLWGDYRHVTEHPISRYTIARFFCPHCHAELQSEWLCPLCDGPLIPLVLRDGGMIRFCARRGCEEHMLDLGD